MKISDVCTWEQVRVRGGLAVGWQIVPLWAWRHRELAVHEQIGRPGIWGITILPLGLGLPPEWASFTDVRHAVAAMVEIAKLKNGWHLIRQDDFTKEFMGRMKTICIAKRAVVTRGMAGQTMGADVDDEGQPLDRLNGYRTMNVTFQFLSPNDPVEATL